MLGQHRRALCMLLRSEVRSYRATFEFNHLILVVIAYTGHVNCIRVLLGAGGNLEDAAHATPGLTPLFFAASHRQEVNFDADKRSCAHTDCRPQLEHWGNMEQI